jgi:DNA-binding SARP family transcriptional activator/TolB-like protein/Tfp pilus assembly protein PilF
MRADEHISRGHLASLLWSDSGEEQARANLRQTLSQLRKLFQRAGADPIVVPFDKVVLRSEGIEIDARAILNGLSDEELVALAVKPAFLEEFFVSAPEFEYWMMAQRNMIQSSLLSQLEQAAGSASERGQHAAAAACSSAALTIDPLQEKMHRTLMQALVAQGRSDEALSQYERCQKVLARELGIEPETQTRKLAAEVRARRAVTGGVVPLNGTSRRVEEAPNLEAPVFAAPAHAHGNRLSIVVSPFTGLSGDAEQDYLCRTLYEDIIAELTRWRLFSVQSHAAPLQPNSAQTEGPVDGNGKARYIVEGSVRRMDGFMRIAVKLIDTEAGHHVWAERFDCGMADIPKVQDQLVNRIVGTLVGRTEAAAAERANRKSPTSPAAYECVLQGNALPWDDPEGGAEARRLFSKAIEIDPGYGLAHALLAAITLKQWHKDLGESDTPLNEAYQLARKAVELESDESTCFAILGVVCMFRGSFDIALQHLHRALEINPGNQWNTADMGSVLLHAGQHEAALAYLDRARQIDPYFDPPWYWCCVGLANMLLHRYQDAIIAFDRFPARNYHVTALLAGCHARLADTKQAASLIKECLSLRPALRVTAIMKIEPFKYPADAAHIAECLKMAGLPA